MNERRVRAVGRPQYGRPTSRPTRGRSTGPSLPPIPPRYAIFCIGLVLVLFGFYKLFQINTIAVVAPSRGDVIKAEALQIKQGSLKQGNLATLNAGQFEAKLKGMDPLILNAQIQRRWLHTLRIVINLKQPGIGWVTGNQSYLVDRDGTVIDALPADTSLAVVTDDSNLPVKIGQRIVTGSFVGFVDDIMPKIVASGYKVTKLEVKETTIDLYVTTDKGYQLIFDTSRDAAGEIADLRGVQATLASQKKAPTTYIDLRIPNKAYWK